MQPGELLERLMKASMAPGARQRGSPSGTGADAADRRDVEAVLAGGPERFAGIVERWQDTLIGLAYRFVGDRGLAEEMAHEAFIQAFRRLGQWRRQAPFATWLYGLALNAYRSKLRALRRAALVGPLPDELRDPSEAGEELLEEERRAAVRREVLRLPAKYRETLVLFYFEERSLAGTAARLGLPEGTVKARLHRGRELLRKRLEGVLG